MTFIMKLAAWTLTLALLIGLASRIAPGQNKFGRDIETKGPNPTYSCAWQNCTSTNFWGVANATTGTISRGALSTLTLASIQDFVQGMGLLVIGAGPVSTIAKPTGLTVTPGGVSGSTFYSYCVVDEDYFGGRSACSTPASTSTGPATIGQNSFTLTGCTRSAGIVTCNTTGTHHLVPGKQVYIVYGTTTPPSGIWFNSAGPFSYEGMWTTISASGTQFQFTQFGWPDDPVGSKGGTLQVLANVVVRWNIPTAGTVLRHHVYRCNAGCSSPPRNFNYVGTSVGDDGYFDDHGVATNLSLVDNGDVPHAAQAIRSNQYLSTTISSIAGKVITLATPATNAVTNALVLHDNGSNLIATCNAFITGTGPRPQNGGQIYIPTTTIPAVNTGKGFYPKFPIASNFDFSSCVTPGGVNPQIDLLVGTDVWATGTIITRPYIRIAGTAGGNQGQQFSSFYPVAPVGVIEGTAFPLVLLGKAGGYGQIFEKMTFQVPCNQSPGQNAMVIQAAAGYKFVDTAIQACNPGGPALITRTSTGFGIFMYGGSVSTGGLPPSNMQNSPGWVNSQQCGVGGGFANLTQIIATHDTFIDGNPAAYDVETCGRGGAAAGPDFHHSISESTIGPFYAVTSSVGGGAVASVNGLTLDNSGPADMIGGVGPPVDLTLANTTYSPIAAAEINTFSNSNAAADGTATSLGCPGNGIYTGIPVYRGGSQCNSIEQVVGIDELFYSPSTAPRGGGSGHVNVNTVAAPVLSVCSSSCGAANLNGGTYNLWLVGSDLWGTVSGVNPALAGGHGTLLSAPASITLTPGTNCTTSSTCAITVGLPVTNGVVSYYICWNTTTISAGPLQCSGLYAYNGTKSVTFLGGAATANPNNYFNMAVEYGFDQYGVTGDVFNVTTRSSMPSAISGVSHLATIGGVLTTDAPFSSVTYKTATTCASTSGACRSAASGSVTIAAATTTVTVSTTAVTANSQIHVTEDSSLGSRLNVTCNTTTGRAYTVTAREAGTRFTITASAAPVTNPACLSYSIIN